MTKRSTQSRERGSRGGLRPFSSAPCGVKGRSSLLEFGATPQLLLVKPTQKEKSTRCRQRSVPASNFAHPQMRPPSCSIYHSHIVAPDGRDRVAGLSVIAAFSRKQGISSLRRRVGGNENRRMSAVAPDTPSQRTPMFLDFFRKLFILFPDSPAPSACAFSLLASAHST